MTELKAARVASGDKGISKLHSSLWSGVAAAGLFAASPALGQESQPAEGQEAQPAENRVTGAVDALGTEIVVTATKRGDELAQDVPVAITALGADQLQALNFQTLQSLTYTIPNVQLEDIGTTKGVANFSIRGLGINSSIPSIDPTVGVFVDGVYMGITSGILLDNFDLEAVEVLRGPQGVLFGRNVTGGAVLIRTKKPTSQLRYEGRAGIETGLRWTVDSMVSGPLTETLSGKISAYYSRDNGWLRNDFDGESFGKSKQWIVRGALRWVPSAATEFLLRYEHGDIEGDGPAGQNHALFSRDSFDFSINEPGFTDQKWDSASLEANVDVGFGDGTITNIAAWRQYKAEAFSDIDSTPATAFHAGFFTDQDQFSEELRYAGTFGDFKVTTGLYYFTQDLLYIETRLLDTNVADANPPITRVGGGKGKFSTTGAFAALDWAVTDTLSLNAGIRYSREKKNADISRIRRAADPLGGPGLDTPGEGVIGGDRATKNLVFSDLNLRPRWRDWSPKIGINWEPTKDLLIYGFWAKGFRSGGFNFRHTALGTPARAVDSESQSSFELGMKSDWFDRRVRLNLALFHNKIKDIQREENLPDPVSGVQQIIRNAGDVTVKGFEAEGRIKITNSLLLSAQVGYTSGKYDKVIVDLDGGGIGPSDLALELPRLSPWTYGANLVHDLKLGSLGTLSSRLSYNHRDRAFYTDNNIGFLNEVDIFDVNFTFRPDNGPWSLSLYGQNLTNETSYGGDTVLPNIAAFGGDGAGPRPLPTFSPLNRGRVLGAEVRLKF